MHADRVLGDGSWMRGKRPKSTNVARNKQAGVHGFELPARTRRAARKWRRSTFHALVTVCARSPQRVPAPRNVDNGRPPISLSGSAYKSRPGLSSRQGPSRGLSSTGGSANVTSRWCVNKSGGRQTLRRLLSCLPASKPDSRFVLSVPLLPSKLEN